MPDIFFNTAGKELQIAQTVQINQLCQTGISFTGHSGKRFDHFLKKGQVVQILFIVYF